MPVAEGCGLPVHDIDEGQKPAVPAAPEPPASFTPIPEGPRTTPTPRTIRVVKYFVHGFLLWIVFLPVTFLWAFLALGLVICGYILGLILAVAILIILYGYVNAWVSHVVWFDVETGLAECFFHGLFLFLLSLIPAAVQAVAGSLFPWTGSGLRYTYLIFDAPLPEPRVLAATLVFYFFFMGYAGRGVAAIWEKPPPPAAVPEPEPEAEAEA